MRERLRTDYHWTERQRQVLDLMARGKTNAEIGEALGISLDGAKWHVSEILSKLQAESREEAAEYWRRYNGLAPRFGRVFRGMVGAGMARWLAIGGVSAVAVGAGVASAVLLWSRGGDEDAAQADIPPTSTPPTPAATADPASRWVFPPPQACPVPDARPCSSAVALADALRSGDFAALRDVAHPIQITCPDVPNMLSSSACSAPHSPGEVLEVLGAGKFGGGAGVQLWEHTEQFLRDSLASARRAGGAAEINVGGIGCMSAQQGTGECQEFAVLIIVGHASGDQVLQFAFRSVDGVPGFYGVVNWVPWDPKLRSGDPVPATYGISPEWHQVPEVSFIPWTPLPLAGS